MDIGDNCSCKCVQLAVLTGIPSEEIKVGHQFRWGKGTFRVDSVGKDEAQICRLAEHEIKSDGGFSYVETPTQFEDKERFHELDFWENPNPTTEGPSGGYPPFTKPKTGPIDLLGLPALGLPADVNKPAQSVSERVEVLGPSKVSDRPPLRYTPDINEIAPDDRKFSASTIEIAQQLLKTTSLEDVK